MTTEEAWEHLQNGGIISCGSYTYHKDGYFAFGTYPGCFRGGDITKECLEGKEWKAVCERDIVKRIGYKYDAIMKPLINDGSVWFDRLREYVEDRVTVSDYSNPTINSELCKKFYEEEWEEI